MDPHLGPFYSTTSLHSQSLKANIPRLPSLPSQWLTLLPFTTLRIFLSFAATALSLFFLTRNLYPVISNAPNVSARLLIVAIAGLHLIMGMALWWGFLAGGKGALHTPTLPGGDDTGAGAGTGGEMDDPAGDALRRWLF